MATGNGNDHIVLEESLESLARRALAILEASIACFQTEVHGDGPMDPTANYDESSRTQTTGFLYNKDETYPDLFDGKSKLLFSNIMRTVSPASKLHFFNMPIPAGLGDQNSVMLVGNSAAIRGLRAFNVSNGKWVTRIDVLYCWR